MSHTAQESGTGVCAVTTFHSRGTRQLWGGSCLPALGTNDGSTVAQALTTLAPGGWRHGFAHTLVNSLHALRVPSQPLPGGQHIPTPASWALRFCRQTLAPPPGTLATASRLSLSHLLPLLVLGYRVRITLCGLLPFSVLQSQNRKSIWRSPDSSRDRCPPPAPRTKLPREPSTPPDPQRQRLPPGVQD